MHESTHDFRVRYGHTDQLGSYYYGHVPAWFEAARTEWTRDVGMTYAELEQRGVYLPVVELQVKYRGRAKYDSLLRCHTTARMAGRASVRFDVRIVHADTGDPVAEGYTIHALINADGKPVRPPDWFVELMREQGE